MNIARTKENSWLNLFRAAKETGPMQTVGVRVIRKAGEPFLILPNDASLAARSLCLYPAQRPAARMARTALRFGLRVRLPRIARGEQLRIDLSAPLPQFICRLVGSSPEHFPSVTILAGNPNTAGRRFIMLVFNARKKPVAVVKAGLDEAAARLIASEEYFLKNVAPKTPGVPQLRDALHSSPVNALALDFFDGDSPDVREEKEMASLLNSWLDTRTTTHLGEMAAWQQLQKASRSTDLFARLAARLADKRVHPAIYHGDFAPWNIKVEQQNKQWTVLDWERGELKGISGWDWFHFVLQPAILVKRQSLSALADTAESLLKVESFRLYAQTSGIAGSERDLLLAYLLYCRDVLRPSEGLTQTAALLNILSRR